MTRLTDSAPQTESAYGRRHVDPPFLWWVAIAGSVGVHLLLALTLRWWSIRAAIAQPSASNAIPIELIEIAPETATDPEAATTSAPTTQNPATTSAPTQAENETIALDPGATAIIPDSVGAVVPSPRPSPPPDQPPQTNPSTSAALPFTPPVIPSPKPSPEPNSEAGQETNAVPPTAENSQAPIPPDNSSVTPTEPNPLPEQPPRDSGALPPEPESTQGTLDGSKEPTANPENPTGSEAETASNSAPAASTTPDAAPAAGSDGLGESIGQVSVNQNPVPAQFQASLSTSAPTGVGDIPDRLAEPKFSNQTFLSDAASASGCLLDPESVRYFGQSVELRIAIDEQGRVLRDATVVRQPSGSPAFDQLAQCVIATWEFTSAFDRINNVDSAVFSNLDVRVTINPVN